MNNDSQMEIDEDTMNNLLRDVLFLEKKNANSKDLKESEMIKEIMKFIEKELRRNEIQADEVDQLQTI